MHCFDTLSDWHKGWRRRLLPTSLCGALLIALAWQVAAASAPKVLFVSPSHAEDPFFQHVELYTRMAAANLDFELDVLYGEGNRLLQLRQLEQYLVQHEPNYVVVQPYSGGAKALMDFLAQFEAIKVVTFERILLPAEEPLIGVPGQHYRNWIAEIYFDNAAASREMSTTLFDHCRQEARAGRNQVIGLNGAHGFESNERGSALAMMARWDPDFQFEQVVFSQWQRELATQQSQLLLRRYPNTSVIWAASDWMALGVLDGLGQSDEEDSQRYCIGGFDWLPESIDAIKQGNMVASAGGHYMMGAWAMVVIYDHWHGALPDDLLTGKAAFALEVISKDNVQQYLPLLQPDYWQAFDFRRLSFRHQPEQSSYHFVLLEP